MAGYCVGRLSHSCGSFDSLQVFEEDGKFSGYCFNCGTYVANPYSDKPEGYKPTFIKKTPEMIEAEMLDIASCPTVDLPDRRLKEFALKAYNVKIGLSESDGKTPKLHYYPCTKDGVISGYKVRLIENKRMWSVGDVKDCDLFGWELAKTTGAKTLYITEGELDAISLYQMLRDRNRGTKYEDFEPAVVSIPHGASAAAKDLALLMPEIRKLFKDVVFIPDNDDAGKEAADKVAKLFPQIQIAYPPLKDVNECLMEGKSNACINSILFKASVPKNTRLILGSNLREAAKKKPEMGLPFPWAGLTKLLRGKRRKETHYWGAGVKMGKSEVVDTLAINDINALRPVFIAKPEQAAAASYNRLVAKKAGKIFHDPSKPFDEKAFDEAEKAVGDLAIILDSYQSLSWDTLKEDMRYAATAYNVKDFYIDPITVFSAHMSASETNEFLVGMANEASELAMDLDLTINFFCHLKAPSNGEPHEMGGKVLSTQFAGSRAMMRSCNLMIGIEGNKDPDLNELERNMRSIVVLEDREFGATGRIQLFWDKNTGLFNEVN